MPSPSKIHPAFHVSRYRHSSYSSVTNDNIRMQMKSLFQAFFVHIPFSVKSRS
ncbi:hypothetical protein LINPERPRIM_LOCUS26537 [Linum perenne]